MTHGRRHSSYGVVITAVPPRRLFKPYGDRVHLHSARQRIRADPHGFRQRAILLADATHVKREVMVDRAAAAVGTAAGNPALARDDEGSGKNGALPADAADPTTPDNAGVAASSSMVPAVTLFDARRESDKTPRVIYHRLLVCGTLATPSLPSGASAPLASAGSPAAYEALLRDLVAPLRAASSAAALPAAHGAALAAAGLPIIPLTGMALYYPASRRVLLLIEASRLALRDWIGCQFDAARRQTAWALLAAQGEGTVAPLSAAARRNASPNRSLANRSATASRPLAGALDGAPCEAEGAQATTALPPPPHLEDTSVLLFQPNCVGKRLGPTWVQFTVPEAAEQDTFRADLISPADAAGANSSGRPGAPSGAMEEQTFVMEASNVMVNLIKAAQMVAQAQVAAGLGANGTEPSVLPPQVHPQVFHGDTLEAIAPYVPTPGDAASLAERGMLMTLDDWRQSFLVQPTLTFEQETVWPAPAFNYIPSQIG
ncbi:hypothetical protein CXG81DRAFT_18954 [Caulochytrium protostelioides]|uniref:Uncharacterized protein n=1 Tax=Caulochytrium protostelioides TaxID=1555241 RepID=A0A4P9X8D1_9FUNG|nr:hypothetical protein CXG81DRAFT_18954 [Caulochytrium protostelioides]|eukprot:RKP01231.1 hypothetical protein CXG81DRAFT_18954 [Caulochytrium protostelioides]